MLETMETLPPSVLFPFGSAAEAAPALFQGSFFLMLVTVQALPGRELLHFSLKASHKSRSGGGGFLSSWQLPVFFAISFFF